MKNPPLKYHHILTGLSLFIFSFIASAATKTATISISANIVPACTAGTTVSGTTTFGTLDFGTKYQLIQPVAVTGQTNSGAIAVQCAAGVGYKVVLSAGNSGNVSQRYMQGTVITRRVNYNLYTDAAHTTIWDNTTGVSKTVTGLAESLPVYGLVPVQTTPPMDSYSDAVTVTVSW